MLVMISSSDLLVGMLMEWILRALIIELVLYMDHYIDN